MTLIPTHFHGKRPEGAIERALEGLPMPRVLGTDYGLVFVNKHGGKEANEIWAARDAQQTQKLISEGDYHAVHYDIELRTLFYTRGTALYAWRQQLLHDFGSPAWGITSYKNGLAIALDTENRVANQAGKELFTGLNDPLSLTVLNRELYHTESSGGGKALVKTPKEIIKKWNTGVRGITTLDNMLYVGTNEGKLFKYDGKKIEEIVSLKTALWSLQGVLTPDGPVVYAGGPFSGIRVIPLNKPKNRTRILEKETGGVLSIARVPLPYIMHMLAN